ncbi:MAG: DDE-type integrase/transposase/recombinase [Methylobacter sp.]|uniref:Mu transposase C-terminal domain-containing protein n=1 Tax=Methylobacter sp. TaxID=2051955 RepID=UPI00273186A6|nr:DDE-type integrase/transposase/recombinase [Methylobacter sp.]MDP1666115.1 DDE-type integrase/transposase/recombinase [Methylobacter sp.]
MSNKLLPDEMASIGIAMNRQRLKPTPGAYVSVDDKVYQIKDILSFESATGVDVETGRTHPLLFTKMKLISTIESNLQAVASQDIDEIASKDWKIATERYEAIKPLLVEGGVPKKVVRERAQELGVGVATLYRWIQKFKGMDVLTALIPQQRGYKKGKNRLSQIAETIIESVINEIFLKNQRSTQKKVILEVERRCHQKQITPPSNYAIRARIAKLSDKTVLRARGFREKAKNKYKPVLGSFPNATHPLAVVQIDHTPADIILVDDLYRKPIGRPWITLAIDVYSRMVTGYYLSFDAPSETSVAMCVAHAILPKEDWLKLHDVDAEWNVWGFPETIHTDNGADFRSGNFKKSCLVHNIKLEFRPVKQPQYGGHIERLLGTLLQEIHDLPGTTFSNIKKRDGYDSEKNAVMTFSEFEKWLVTLICKIYHKREHSSLGLTPSKQWEIGIFGNATTPPRGVPERPVDKHSLLLDFLPYKSRTIQNYGAEIDGLYYFDDVLIKWINSTKPDDKSKKRKFIFRIDPRDISSVWFYEPDLKKYFEIFFSDRSLPSMSSWEFKQAKSKARKEGMKSVNIPQLMDALTDLRQQTEDAKGKTKSARLKEQRSRIHAKKVTPANPTQIILIEQSSIPLEVNSNFIDADEDIKAFDDLA